jgi:hypothetical protein
VSAVAQVTGGPSLGTAAANAVRTGRRMIDKGELKSENINVISAQKTNTRDLMYTGDSFEVRQKRADDIESGEATTIYGEDPKKKCNVCCMIFGSVVVFSASLGQTVLHTGIFAYRDQHRVRLTMAKCCRHATWMLIPSCLIGTTMHYFVCDALWSKRRNTYGMAWLKAVGMNTAVWGSGIALGTLFWRRGLRLTAAGSRLYYRYPAAHEGLELRLVENPSAALTGMTWTYWAYGLITGQVGYLACAAAVVWQDRVHIMMSPQGSYAEACAPWWRREAIASATGLTLKRETERPKVGQRGDVEGGDGEPGSPTEGKSKVPSVAFSAKA